MDNLTTNRKSCNRKFSPFLLIGLITLIVLGVAGCVTKTECDRLVREAIEHEQTAAAARIKALEDEKNAEIKRLSEELTHDREKFDAETKRLHAEFEAEVKRLSAEVEEQKMRIAATNYHAGTLKQPFPEYQSLGAPSLIAQSLYWFCLLITMGTLGAAGVWLIRDPVTWTQWTKALVVPVSIYAFMRFMAGLTTTIFSTSLVHTGLIECVLVVLGFISALLFEGYVRGQRRLPLDLLGLTAASLLMMGAAEFFALNREALQASTLGLRLTACAPIGVAIFAIARAVKQSTLRNAAASGRGEELGNGRGATKFRSVVSN